MAFDLQQEWWQLWTDFPKQKKSALEEGFIEIHQRYSESVRAYHNLTHLNNLFLLRNQYQDQIKDPFVLSLAIWYHDVIYNPRRRDNEEKSAQFAQDRLSDWGVEGAVVEQVVAMIRATAHHLDVTTESESDLAFFLDFDLAILGSTPEAYAHYAAAVRQEYGHVPGFLYRRGRKKVLRYFLAAEQLFRTEPFLALEKQARINLKRELAAY